MASFVSIPDKTAHECLHVISLGLSYPDWQYQAFMALQCPEMQLNWAFHFYQFLQLYLEARKGQISWHFSFPLWVVKTAEMFFFPLVFLTACLASMVMCASDLQRPMRTTCSHC